MASTRQVAKLVQTVACISSGAILTLQGRSETTRSGLEIVAPLINLIATTLFIKTDQTTPDDFVRAEAFLCRLIRRYGTARQALDAVSTGHRRHDHLSIERAHTWSQVLSVTPGMIESTLRRHGSFNQTLAAWIDAQGHEVDRYLDAYRAWLDGPLTGNEQEWGIAGTSAPLSAAVASDQALPDATDSSIAGGRPAIGEGEPDESDLAVVRDVVLGEKFPGDDASFLPLTPGQRTAAQRLAASGCNYAQAIAAVALGDFIKADMRLSSPIEGISQAELYTLRGDRYYYDGRFDEAMSEYLAARRERDDLLRRLNVAVTLMRTTRGAAEDAYKQATDLLAATKLDLRTDDPASARVGLLLGAACVHRPGVAKAQCIEHAIEHLESALVLLSRDRSPDLWAQAHYQLALAWLEAPFGDQASNMQKAVRHLGLSAEVWTREENPGRWAIVHNAAGHAWERSPRGDRASNLEHALVCFSAALEVRTQEADPIGWARLQNNLANIWLQFPGGDHAANINRAIECQTRALDVWSRLGRRVEWAATQSNLGNAWALLPAKDELRERNLRRAVACYKSALEVRTRSTHPNEWASTLNNLGTALLHMPPTKKGEAVKEAIQCFEQALEVRTREALPTEWAKTQANLGQAWSRVPTGDESENLQEAIAYFECALEVYTPLRYPHQHKHVTARLEEARRQLTQAEAKSARTPRR